MVGIVVEKGPSKGGNDVTRTEGWVGKGDQGRTFREMFLFPCLFSSFRPLLPTRPSFLAREIAGIRGREGEGRKKKKKRWRREEKGRCKPREKGLGGVACSHGYVAPPTGT